MNKKPILALTVPQYNMQMYLNNKARFAKIILNETVIYGMVVGPSSKSTRYPLLIGVISIKFMGQKVPKYKWPTVINHKHVDLSTIQCAKVYKAYILASEEDLTESFEYGKRKR